MLILCRSVFGIAENLPKNIIGTVQQDAIIFSSGIYLGNLTVGYSYDFTISPLSTSAGGAHEVSLVYDLQQNHCTAV